MDLKQIREQFVKQSGRYDLISEAGQDEGANFFIQSGSRFLDRRSNIRHTQAGAVVYRVTPTGLLKMPECWFIREVHLQWGDTWQPLKQITHRRTPNVLFRKTGVPNFFVLRTVRYLPDMSRMAASLVSSPATAFDHQDMTSHVMTIEVLPHPTCDVVIEVYGDFYGEPLINDTDSNVWSENFPDLLIKAALYQLEIFYRNTEGANDWLSSIQLDLTDAEQLEIFKDLAGNGEMGL